MTLPRLLNFAGFCVVVVAMLAVEFALWNRGLIDQTTRTRLHYAGFGVLGSCVAVEIYFEWHGERGGRARSRGFPVIWRKDKT